MNNNLRPKIFQTQQIYRTIVLVVVFWEIAIQSYPLPVSAQTSQVEVGTSEQLHCTEIKNNAVEVEGLIFEILIPERVWNIPQKPFDVDNFLKKRSHVVTPLKIGICITNNRTNPVRLNRLDPLIVLGINIINKADGSKPEFSGARDLMLSSPQLICPLLLPKESVKFFLDSKLFWQKNKLVLGGSDGLGGGWFFQDIKAGNYQVQFLYNSSSSVASCYGTNPLNYGKVMPEIAKDLWGGEAATPFIDVEIKESFEQYQRY